MWLNSWYPGQTLQDAESDKGFIVCGKQGISVGGGGGGGELT